MNAFNPEVQMQQLVHRISVAKAEAGMLNESLAYTSSDNFDKNEIVQVSGLYWHSSSAHVDMWSRNSIQKFLRGRTS